MGHLLEQYIAHAPNDWQLENLAKARLRRATIFIQLRPGDVVAHGAMQLLYCDQTGSLEVRL
jgi:hypothetical protein